MVAVNEQYRGIARGGNAPCLGHLPFSHDSSVIQNRLLFVDRCSLIIERSADAFGIKIAGAGSTPNQILCSGEFLDPGTGNYDLRNRIYQQTTGTFLTADTTPGQLPYVYTSDNPIMFADPGGRFGIMSTLSAISLTSFLAGSVGAAFGGAEHGLRGVEAGFFGGFAGTASTLIALDLLAPITGPSALPLAFGVGGAVDTLVQDVTVEGWKALGERSTWEGAVASFVVSSAFGWAGGATLYYINKEVAADFASLPSVWNVLGKIQTKSLDVAAPDVFESGLQQTFSTLLKFYIPELMSIGRDLLMDEATSGFRNLGILPIAQFLVNFAYDSLEGQPAGATATNG